MTEIVWEGPDQLRPMLVPIRSLERHPRNPRLGKVDEIGASLERFGQVRPVLADGPLIVAGNHTWQAAVDLGWTHIAAVAHRFEDESEARAYLLADNRLPELGSYDHAQLIPLLEDLEMAGSWGGTGYNSDALDDLRALHNQVTETERQTFSGDYALTAEELADRATQLSAGRAMSEIVLTLTAAQNADFESYVKILGKEYGEGGGVTETVFRAVNERAARV